MVRVWLEWFWSSIVNIFVQNIKLDIQIWTLIWAGLETFQSDFRYRMILNLAPDSELFRFWIKRNSKTGTTLYFYFILSTFDFFGLNPFFLECPNMFFCPFKHSAFMCPRPQRICWVWTRTSIWSCVARWRWRARASRPPTGSKGTRKPKFPILVSFCFVLKNILRVWFSS